MIAKLIVTIALIAVLSAGLIYEVKSKWSRFVALATFAAAALSVLSFVADLTGRPRNVYAELSEVQEATVLAARMMPGKAIYVWAMPKGGDEPVYYELPWDENVAKAMKKAQKEAEENGTDMGLQIPFEHSWDKREPKFYPLPQPKMPDKPNEEQAPHVYKRPGMDA